MYLGLVQAYPDEVTAFYLKPNSKRFAFDKQPVGINTLNNILPSQCKEAGFKRKTSHSLRVTYTSGLFNAGVEEKLIRDRTGHRSNALFKFEKIGEVKSAEVSEVLAPKWSTTNEEMTKDTEGTVEIGNSRSSWDQFMASTYFKNCLRTDVFFRKCHVTSY